MYSYLQRYLQGEYIPVWEELEALGDDIREEPLFSDAQAVAREAMRRVRFNFELAISRLREHGYVFLHDQPADPKRFPPQVLSWIHTNPPLYKKPSADISTQLDALEQEIGPLPISLRIFYEEIGGINFTGWYAGKMLPKPSFYELSQGAMEGFDPVFVYSFHPDLIEVADVLFSSSTPQELWPSISDDDTSYAFAEERATIIIAPDTYHKANKSGGPPLQIPIPTTGIDAPLLNEVHQACFVNYLRICCYYAGLPGLERLDGPLSDQHDELRAGMLLF